MFAGSRSTNLIGDRLDAGFYSPHYVEIEKQLSGCALTVGRLGAKLQRVYKGAFYVLASEYRSTGVAFLRVTQITSGFVDLREVVYLSPEVHRREQKTAVRPGYLVFAKGGSIGNCAVIPETLPEANISQDMIGVVPAEDLDSHYAQAFLSSAYGRPQLLRWAQGDVQPHVTNDSVKHVLIPFLQPLAQAYIGDKVRQAERLRARATLSLRFATRLVEMLIDGDVSETDIKACTIDRSRVESAISQHESNGRRHTRTPSGALIDRIDAWYYQPHLAAACAKIAQSGSCNALAEVIDGERDVKGGATPWGADYLLKGPVRFYRTSDVWGLAVHTKDTVFITAEQDQELARSRLADGDVLLTITGADFGHAGVVTQRHIPGNISQHSVRFHPKIDASYLVAYLESSYGQRVIWRQAYGATRPAIDYPGVKGLLIRVPDPAVQKVIGDAVRSGVMARDIAQSLTTAAKLLVEGMIDGKVTEADLQAAHTDPDADRTILRQLTAKGMGIADEPPLFLDLTQLEQVLADSGGPLA
jgi:hypothetical protein